MLDCTLKLDPNSVFTLAMRETGSPRSGYHLILRPKTQEAELLSAAFSQPRRVELDTTKPIRVQAFVQGSIIEVFINDQYSLTCRAYDYEAGNLHLSVSGGTASLVALQVKVPHPTTAGMGLSARK